MIGYDSPGQRDMQLEGMRNDIEWLFIHKRCRTQKYEKGERVPHNRLYHIRGIYWGFRYLLGYYLKCLARKIQGEKVTYYGKYKGR